MTKSKERIAIALENIVMQLRVLNSGRDAFYREALDVLSAAKDSDGSLRSGQPAAAPDGQEAGTVAVRPPRVWTHQGADYDPEPEGDVQVRDRHGDIWYPMARNGDNARLWETDETAPFTWERVLKKWGPLVEVVGACPEGS